ncbi:putative SprA-related family protein [Campylobacter iguaniorum]|uniref:putative metalloprotease CJM1_0395 family protein n=1 Tax=Campylobacter iguaniorum TaxID=1244531 RepID=UPI0007C8B1B7|nr:putative metalloprotease CJM1_0395 family protein [Campylobacter iguaniorum]ANE35796.1 putative SprA-related family protein [Campylobacter iguaniorum]
MTISGSYNTSQIYIRKDKSNESSNAQNPQNLDQKEQLQVAKLQQRDAEVRAHEASHMAAGAGLTRGVNYTYQKGPDSKMYAVGGEVSIDTSPGNTPEETIKKAAQIKRAALAPSNPSPADLQVAASAANMEVSAKAEQMSEQKSKDGETNNQSQAKKSKNPYEKNSPAIEQNTIGYF